MIVLAECSRGQVEKVTFELLGDARKLAAGLKGPVEIVLLAAPDESVKTQQQLQGYVRERVHVVEHPLLGTYSTETFLQALVPLFHRLRPRVALLAASANWRDLGARLAARL